MSLQDLILALKGGKGSRDWGHRGRPGRTGGSGGGGGLSGLGLKPTSSLEERRQRVQLVNGKRGRVKRGVAAVVESDPQWLKDRVAKFGKPDANSSLKGSSQKKPSKMYKEGLTVEEVLKNEKFAINNSAVSPFQKSNVAHTVEVLSGTEHGRAILGYVNGMSTYVDEKTGIYFDNLDIFRYSSNDTSSIDRVEINAVIRSKEGIRIGNVTRIFDMNTLDVHHDYMRMNSEGTGFGARFYHESEKAYIQAGFKTVTIQANIDVGGYAWARMGYDENPEKSRSARHQSPVERANDAYERAYGSPPPNPPKTAYEAAALTGPDGRRVGKEALLGTNWYAIKNLDENDPGYQAGLDYYRSKGVEVD